MLSPSILPFSSSCILSPLVLPQLFEFSFILQSIYPFVLPGTEAAAGGGSAPTPLAGLGSCKWHKKMSEIFWELCKEAALGDSTVVISTTKNRALQAFFFLVLS